MRGLGLKAPSFPAADRPRSLRSIRLGARAPQIVLMLVAAVVCVAGLRAIFAGPSSSTIVERAPARPSYDVGAAAFAQSFARAYLSWQDEEMEARAAALEEFFPEQLRAGSDGGLQPAPGSSQSVSSTEVVDQSRLAATIDVVVLAETSAGPRYLSVPVGRDERGALYVAAYPAFVGPPAAATEVNEPSPEAVDDAGLETVARRSLGNYLAGEAANLRADLTSDAIVSLPAEPLQLRRFDSLDWLLPGRAVAAQVEARDESGDDFTLSYQLRVVRRGRWYVQSIQFDPTLQGGS